MSARLLENNDLHVLSGQPKLGFLGIGDKQEAARKLANQVNVQSRYPFPPKTCADAQLKIDQIDAEIKSHQEVIATQGDSRVDRRWIEALVTVKDSFTKWILASQCEKQITQEQDQQFYDQLNAAIDKEKSASQGSSKADNWIIYGVLGILGFGALAIILKK